jgi:hypothetical protein
VADATTEPTRTSSGRGDPHVFLRLQLGVALDCKLAEAPTAAAPVPDDPHARAQIEARRRAFQQQRRELQHASPAAKVQLLQRQIAIWRRAVRGLQRPRARAPRRGLAHRRGSRRVSRARAPPGDDDLDHEPPLAAARGLAKGGG